MSLYGHDIAGVNGAGIITEALKGQFTIVKASEGLSWRDPEHPSFVKTLRAAHQPVGHYHYAWAKYDPVSAARNFVSIASPLAGETLWLDFEEAYHHEPAPEATWPEWIISFIHEVNNRSGASCGLYLNNDIGSRVFAHATSAQASEMKSRFPFWKAFYGAHPGNLFGWSVLTMWQYSGTHIDKDVFEGSITAWNALAVPGKAAPTPPPPPDPKPKPKPQPQPGPTAFPLPLGDWYGVNDGTPHSHSGIQPGDIHYVFLIQRDVGCRDVDGKFGAHTESRVKSFQKRHHLTTDGKVGPKTWGALMSVTHFPFPLGKGYVYAEWDGSGHHIWGSEAQDKPNIRMIQKKVHAKTDGVYGSHTHEYVKKYQHSHNLSVDGVVGPHTWREMF